MTPDDAVTKWLDRLKAGDSYAATQLLLQFWDRAVNAADYKLGNLPRRDADEEDVAQEAFNSFFQGILCGRFPRLDNRDDLWQVLMLLIRQKATDRKRRQAAAKRGHGKVRGDSALGSAEAQDNDVFSAPEPTPETIAQCDEEIARLFCLLGSDELQQIASERLSGNSVAEISNSLNMSRRSVQRKLTLIRDTWKAELDQ